MSQNNKKKTPPFYNFCYDFVKITGILPAIIWMRPKFHYPFGKPKTKGGLMVISNHPTFIDPITVQLSFPFRRLHSLATKDIFSNPVKKTLFTLMHCIIVDKDNFSMSSFREVVGHLEADRAVVIFPEGRVNRNSDTEPLLAFKSGAVIMAHKAGVPILPMYIVKNEKWYHRQHIVFGQTIDPLEMLGRMPNMQELNMVTELLKEKEEKLREYYEALCAKKKG